MLTVAYLANEFPSAVEPYVGEEIEELRRRGVEVITTSVRQPRSPSRRKEVDIVLLPVRLASAIQALLLCIHRWKQIAALVGRVAFHGRESFSQRAKALAHTFLGACYAAKLAQSGVEHIHAHHGYFGSWIAMTAARLLGVGFSLTLHGSDVLLNGTYLDVKLANCAFCLTVSDYNRRYILDRYPEVDARKVIVARLGVELPENLCSQPTRPNSEPFVMLSVGRLHEVKDHAFLVRACARLRDLDLRFECYIAGEGVERRHLEDLIQEYELESCVTLLGHVPRAQMSSLYDRADAVVLTSRSEGIPLLMEAMARGRVVLAPAITGIPELVIPGKTGFMYEPASMDAFVDRVQFIYSLMRSRGTSDQAYVRARARFLHWIRYGARVQVRHNFKKKKNLESFADLFLDRVAPRIENLPDENLILQQI